MVIDPYTTNKVAPADFQTSDRSPGFGTGPQDKLTGTVKEIMKGEGAPTNGAPIFPHRRCRPRSHPHRRRAQSLPSGPAVTLNELSRRVGLAKPNVLRYFESREAVLLELLDRFLQEWLTELAGELAAGIDENLPMAERAAAVAEILSRSLSGRVVLCDLFGAQSSVLEHNVSVEVVARYKRASLDRLTTMTALLPAAMWASHSARTARARFMVARLTWSSS
ncbi:TetR/AcrR family transcriptional regulator [Kitasatospora sp. NPDC048343]|uniref:TetR/AcrR family transcriptional regulator n=1 Tax=Kitasatospora sp. NPDC048343 TaxID=3154717 RepID=UPI0033F5E1AC